MAHVRVVVVNYNAKPWLAECLAALRAQTFRDFDVAVVDNGSSDGSDALAAAVQDERFTLVRAGRNLGFAAGSNLGARDAGDAAFIALLNPDAFPAPDWLEQSLAAAQRHPGAAAFGCHLVDAKNAAVSDGTGDAYHFSGAAWRRDHGAASARAACRPEGEVFAVCAAAALYRRQAWAAADGLDEDFFCYMEDVDLSFRLRLGGWTCMHVPRATCRHIGSATTGQRSAFSVYHGHRNLIWVFVKNMPVPLLWLLLPLHLLLNLAAVVLFTARGQGDVIVRAKRDALAGLGTAWRKRRQVQATRAVSARDLWQHFDKRLWRSAYRA